MRGSSMPDKAVIVNGTPIDGFAVIGPFDSEDEAEEYAVQELEGSDWWTSCLVEPNEPMVIPPKPEVEDEW